MQERKHSCISESESLVARVIGLEIAARTDQTARVFCLDVCRGRKEFLDTCNARESS